MGRPCTTCPSTTVQSCCGNRNLRVASILIGFFKLLMFLSTICLLLSVMAGNSGATDTEKQLAGHSTGQLLIVLALIIAQLFLTLILLAGLFKENMLNKYIPVVRMAELSPTEVVSMSIGDRTMMIYWAANCVLIVLTLLGLFTQPPGVGQFVITFAYIALDIYFQIVIRSHYLEMTGAAAATAEAPKPSATSRH